LGRGLFPLRTPIGEVLTEYVEHGELGSEISEFRQRVLQVLLDDLRNDLVLLLALVERVLAEL